MKYLGAGAPPEVADATGPLVSGFGKVPGMELPWKKRFFFEVVVLAVEAIDGAGMMVLPDLSQ
jgi:hypothetical protein